MGLRRPNLDIAPMGVSPIAQFSNKKYLHDIADMEGTVK